MLFVIKKPKEKNENKELIALYHETWEEVNRLRDYEWKIGYYFISFGAGIILLLLNPNFQKYINSFTKNLLILAQAIAFILCCFYIEKIHEYLTDQRNIRRNLEEIFKFYDRNVYKEDTILPEQWKGKRITKKFQRLGLIVPILGVVFIIQLTGIYLTCKINEKNGDIRINKITKFEYVGIKFNEEEIPAICLLYENEAIAKENFKPFHDYLISPESKKTLNIEFSKWKTGNYSLSIFLSTLQYRYKIKINEIDENSVNKIKNALFKYKYYLILAGYGSANLIKLLPIKNYHLLKKDIIIDGEKLFGMNLIKINWMDLFE